MKIAVVGDGKMGKEIVQLLLESEHAILWMASRAQKREGMERFLAKSVKKVARKHQWTEQRTKQRYETVELAWGDTALGDVSLVIESITENLAAKQALFTGLQEKVDEACIFASNSSALPLSAIFAGVRNKARCAGLHFFYPQKLSNFIEINALHQTNDEAIRCMQALCTELGQSSIFLPERYGQLSSRIILDLMAAAYQLQQEGALCRARLDETLKRDWMRVGIFEILEATGIPIVQSCVVHFADDKGPGRDCFSRFVLSHKDADTGAWKFEDTVYGETDPAVYQKAADTLCALYLQRIRALSAGNDLDPKQLLTMGRQVLGIEKSPEELQAQKGASYLQGLLATGNRRSE